MLGLEGHDRINDAWIASDANLPALLRYNVYLNKVYQDADQRLFNIVPICNIRAHFIRIDTSVLYGILREAGVIGRNVKAKTFEKLRDVFWFDTFDFRKIKPSGSTFEWSVTTDGVSLCTTFEKVVVSECRTGSSSSSSSAYEPSPQDIVVGNDPGRVEPAKLASRLRRSTSTTWQAFMEGRQWLPH